VQLALFDLDNTLLDGDSDIEWSELLARFGAMDVARTRAYHRHYDAGTLDIDEFLRFQLAPLAREPMERLLAWRVQYMSEYVLPRLTLAARAIVSEHARAGHELVLITATNRFITEPIARELGIPHLVATELEMDGGRFTGRVAGRPCYREGKIARIYDWLAARGLAWGDVRESWFYSDSHNDLPLLLVVDHPVVVNGDERLSERARSAGWRTCSTRA
jgi:HAD superfamily hydrolase (TIGR01490 family)